MEPLAAALGVRARPGDLWERLEGNRIRCTACGHRCPIPAGFAGACKVRFNRGGALFVPWGYVAGACCDPIEKKPFFHVLPGARAYSFGMLGCSFHCPYCQNWKTAQVLRDPNAYAPVQPVEPEQLVRRARESGAELVVSTYNEPLITAEWAAAVFRNARAAGLLTGIVSNGNATREVLEYLRSCTDLVKVDLKCFDDRSYRRLGGRLEPVLESIRQIRRLGYWLEVVTLVVPGFNDSAGELRGIARFLAAVSPDIPWHVTAFRRDYKLPRAEETTAAALLRAASIGHEAGLRYVYAGNLPGAVGGLEDTRCPICAELLVERRGNRTVANRISPDGACPACGAAIPGIWRGFDRRPGRSGPDAPLVHRDCG